MRLGPLAARTRTGLKAPARSDGDSPRIPGCDPSGRGGSSITELKGLPCVGRSRCVPADSLALAGDLDDASRRQPAEPPDQEPAVLRRVPRLAAAPVGDRGEIARVRWPRVTWTRLAWPPFTKPI